jgi:branched-chain amino acid transport system permease protein
MKARATIDDPETAEAMGVDTTRVYLLTFALGSAITGAAGGLAAPLLAVTPETGSIFLAEAFIAVVIGGSSVLIGTVSAAGLLGVIDGIFRTAYGAFLGRVSLLCVAILAIRFLPSGISGYINTIRQRRKEKSQ